MLDTEKLLRLLALPSRRRILLLLTTGCFSVSDLQQLLGREQPYVSQQLARLRRVDVVECRREGRRCLYSLADDVRGAVLRGVLKLSSALQSDDPACTFLLAGRSHSELLRAVRLGTADVPCKVIDLVTYEPHLEPKGEATSPSVVTFALKPEGGGASFCQRSLRCAHSVALDLARHEGIQVFKECEICVAVPPEVGGEKDRDDPTSSEDQKQRREILDVALQATLEERDA